MFISLGIHNLYIGTTLSTFRSSGTIYNLINRNNYVLYDVSQYQYFLGFNLFCKAYLFKVESFNRSLNVPTFFYLRVLDYSQSYLSEITRNICDYNSWCGGFCNAAAVYMIDESGRSSANVLCVIHQISWNVQTLPTTLT